MIAEPDISSIASLIGEPARAAMLVSLLDGRALPAGELAFAANVSAQTASAHLAKLVAGKLLALETHGRHRYYKIAGVEVARAIEALQTIAPARKNFQPRPGNQTDELRSARTCYDHLAGRLGVELTRNLRGNLIEVKDYNNYDGSMSEWQRLIYDRKGYLRSLAYLSKDGKLHSVGKFSYDRKGRQKQWDTFDKSRKLIGKSLYFYHHKNEEIISYNERGVQIARSVTLTNNRGDQTEIAYGEDGKPWYKAHYTYRRDTRGNWVKAICSEWRGENGRLIYKRTKVIWRKVVYYQ